MMAGHQKNRKAPPRLKRIDEIERELEREYPVTGFSIEHMRRELAREPKRDLVTFDDAADDLLNDYQANDRRTRADAKRRLTLHLLPVFRGRRLAAIGTADLRAYAADRLQAGAAPGTVNRELSIVGRMFTLAREDGKIRTKPIIRKLEERNARVAAPHHRSHGLGDSGREEGSSSRPGRRDGGNVLIN